MTQTTLAGFARTINPATDIITAYAAAPYSPTATPDPAPTVVIGSFKVPVAVTGRLSIIALCQGSAECTVRLYDPQEVTHVHITNDKDAETLSDVITLTPGKTYQIAVRFQGEALSSNIAVVRTVTLVP